MINAHKIKNFHHKKTDYTTLNTNSTKKDI